MRCPESMPLRLSPDTPRPLTHPLQDKKKEKYFDESSDDEA
jgi:hypothetical protein